ncbi:MAG: carotenoid biosynthesis protein [Nitrospirota bacterium]
MGMSNPRADSLFPGGASRLTTALWLLLPAYTVVSAVMFFMVPTHQVLVLMVTAVCLALIHGSMRYGARGMLVFLLLSSGVGLLMENASIAIGSPFDRYHYTNFFHAPMIGRVPLDVGVLYFGMGYTAWVIGNILLDKADARLNQRLNRIALPVVAAFVLAMWDVVLDPTSSTIHNVWIWHNSGGYFGVPLTNFVGWYVVAYLFFQGFAFYLTVRARHTPIRTNTQGKGYWLPPVVLYLLVAAGYIATYAISPNTEHADALGYVWRSRDIYETAAIISIYTMGFAGGLAVLRLFQHPPEPRVAGSAPVTPSSVP